MIWIMTFSAESITKTTATKLKTIHNIRKPKTSEHKWYLDKLMGGATVSRFPCDTGYANLISCGITLLKYCNTALHIICFELTLSSPVSTILLFQDVIPSIKNTTMLFEAAL